MANINEIRIQPNPKLSRKFKFVAYNAFPPHQEKNIVKPPNNGINPQA
jgi:hypothetical protein